SATHVQMGVASDASGVVSFQKTLSLKNTSGTAQSLTLTAGSLPQGASLAITPSVLSLSPGQSSSVTLQLAVDQAVTPPAPEPLEWSTTLTIATGAQATNVPVYFFRSPELSLAFDEAPMFVLLVNPALHLTRSFTNPGLSLSTVVPP